MRLTSWIAQVEIPDDWSPSAQPDAALHYAMLGTVLFEPLILALRRMAHVSRSRMIIQGARVKPTKKAAQRSAARKKR